MKPPYLYIRTQRERALFIDAIYRQGWRWGTRRLAEAIERHSGYPIGEAATATVIIRLAPDERVFVLVGHFYGNELAESSRVNSLSHLIAYCRAMGARGPKVYGVETPEGQTLGGQT